MPPAVLMQTFYVQWNERCHCHLLSWQQAAQLHKQGCAQGYVCKHTYTLVQPPSTGGAVASFPCCNLQGPRLCEYTGGLFCRRCHSGRTARLPARALHSWDFTPRPGG